MTMNLGLTHNSNPNSTTVTKHEMCFHFEGDGRCDTQIIQMGLKVYKIIKGKIQIKVLECNYSRTVQTPALSPLTFITV
jgi:hypothetical protein